MRFPVAPTLILLLATCFGGSLLAALAPQTEATRYRHLVEVNARWLHETGPLPYADAVAYPDESARIAAHLLAVHEILSARPTSSLSAKQQMARRAALDHLRTYAKARRFPLNTTVLGRRPTFVDAERTHCAVGHLMASSGAEALVARIAERRNDGYVLTDLLALEGVVAWASAHGFTAEELAWIQPAYPGSQIWHVQPFGRGLGATGGDIATAVRVPGGDVLVAGDFVLLDGIYADGLARIRGGQISGTVTTPFAAIRELHPLRTDTTQVLCVGEDADGRPHAQLFDLRDNTFGRSWTFPDAVGVFAHVSDSTAAVWVAELRDGASGTGTRLLRLDPAVDELEQIAPAYLLLGVVRDVYEFESQLGLGGSFVVLDRTGARLDSNHAQLDLATERFLPDADQLASPTPVLTNVNVPVLRFAEAVSGTYRDGSTYFVSDAWFANSAGDLISSGSLTISGGAAEIAAAGFGTMHRVAEPIDSLFVGHLPAWVMHVAGAVAPYSSGGDSLDRSRWLSTSAPFVGVLLNQEVPIDGRLRSLVSLESTPRGDSVLLVGTFSRINGVPARHLAVARAAVSDAPEPAPFEARVYAAAGQLHVVLPESLTRDAELFVYGLDGRLAQRTRLLAGRRDYSLPLAVRAPLAAYAIYTGDGRLATGQVAVRPGG